MEAKIVPDHPFSFPREHVEHGIFVTTVQRNHEYLPNESLVQTT